VVAKGVVTGNVTAGKNSKSSNGSVLGDVISPRLASPGWRHLVQGKVEMKLQRLSLAVKSFGRFGFTQRCDDRRAESSNDPARGYR
jgi:hypothetical protein